MFYTDFVIQVISMPVKTWKASEMYEQDVRVTLKLDVLLLQGQNTICLLYLSLSPINSKSINHTE